MNVCEELAAQGSQLGHFTRVAIASGPRIAEAVARHGPAPLTVVPPGHDALQLRNLPVLALPIDDDVGCWLIRLGVVTVADLARLPREQLAARIGDRAPDILALLDGHDARPLHAYEPPCVLQEQVTWDEGVEQLEALFFVFKRLTSNLSARLEARGLATNVLEVRFRLDRSIARLRGADDHLSFHIDLPAALHRADDLLRTVRSRLERCELSPTAAMLGSLCAVYGWTLSRLMVDAEGRPLDRSKKIYGQAFCIYALSECYLATGESGALEAARRAVELTPDYYNYFALGQAAFKLKKYDEALQAAEKAVELVKPVAAKYEGFSTQRFEKLVKDIREAMTKK